MDIKLGLTHDELASNLARHLLNESRMVWENIPAGRSGSVRPDVYTIEKSFANPNPISYEIKVSVSDFRSDVTSAKWKSYLDFSYGVVFAVPKGLITKNDIPNGCGLITFNGEFWNTVKRPTLNPAKLNDELLMKLLIAGNQRQTQPEVIECRKFDEFKKHDKLRKKFGKDIASKLSFIDDYPEMKSQLFEMRKSLSKLFNIDIDRWNFEREVAYHIENLKVMANEHERKKAIAKELEQAKRQLDFRFSQIIKEYTE
ncbi:MULTISPECIES: MmcB family DNA repair protein [unclassified Vibrio]|uniref:MmcB family DNA repair protein n=1 Tax=unclassified Vibrio TaxID=2614977 RepID=UPI000B8EB036|nr:MULTISPECIES: MmcB family DNA repair protein [unclassified Vibrio]NAX44849.1 MmcB family DNA repair protein [Vibrio sp. V25_P4S6T154]OXX43272.1 DUF1052 domain-containing protein [Vibrio sp. V17_P4S1T151]OXX59150.1 DUF1052 domain-containing protein [Vibrio sp. V15_P4S5T153]OXX65390.1 DUF1052 domain-containing protein [Vibrio sp. V20_P4S3T152]